MKATDYYAALGVPRDADLEHIKKAYRKLARQHHPDVSKAPDAEARFKDAALAYATLKNPEKRAEYDQIAQQFEAAAARRASNSQPHSWPGPQHPSDYESQHVFNDLDLEALLASMGRSQAAERRGPVAMPGLDLETSAQISLLQAHLGTTLHLQLSDQGSTHTLEVTVPAGMKDDQKLRLRGKGGKGRDGGKDGDLYLHITLAPHPLFRADQYDLYFKLALAPWEAALGASVEVPTLEGSVQLTVAPGTCSGRKLRLRGQGMNQGRSAGNTAARGDLYALVQIDVPSALTARERELFQELANTSSFKPRTTATASAAAKENTA